MVWYQCVTNFLRTSRTSQIFAVAHSPSLQTVCSRQINKIEDTILCSRKMHIINEQSKRKEVRKYSSEIHNLCDIVVKSRNWPVFVVWGEVTTTELRWTFSEDGTLNNSGRVFYCRTYTWLFSVCFIVWCPDCKENWAKAVSNYHVYHTQLNHFTSWACNKRIQMYVQNK